MSEKPKVLGVVGARSGSKSIPHKNVKPLLGKPLMAWIIEAAKRSKYLTRVVLSTDSPEYAEIGRKYGAETPFLRPKELAEDHVPDFPWIHHAAVWLAENEGWKADIIVRLPPTSPICKTEDIDACIELLLNDPLADSAYTIIEPAKHPYKMWRVQAAGAYIEPFLSESFAGVPEAWNKPRQSYPKAYFYIDSSAIRWKTLVDNQSLAGKKVCYRVIDEAVDIDTEEDFRKAEAILEKRLQQSDTASKKNHVAVRFFKPTREGPPRWENILVAHAPGLYTGKVLIRKAGNKGGFQKHHLKNESGYVFSGKILFRYDNGDGKISEKILGPGDSVHIPPGAVHQEEALEDSIIFETSTPHFNDRVRMEEKYGLKLEPDPAPSTTIDEVIIK